MCTQADGRAGRDFTWIHGLAKARRIRLAKRKLAATLPSWKTSKSHYLPKKTRGRIEGKRTEATWTRNKTKAEA